MTNAFVQIEAPVEPLIIGYSAARHMRYGRGEPFALHPDATASLFDPSIELVDAKDILEQLDYAAAKKQPGAKKSPARIKDALAKLLPDVGSASSITLYGPSQAKSRFRKSGVQVKTPYGEVPLDALSLGYQTMTALAVDLAWRLEPNDIRRRPSLYTSLRLCLLTNWIFICIRDGNANCGKAFPMLFRRYNSSLRRTVRYWRSRIWT